MDVISMRIFAVLLMLVAGTQASADSITLNCSKEITITLNAPFGGTIKRPNKPTEDLKYLGMTVLTHVYQQTLEKETLVISRYLAGGADSQGYVNLAIDGEYTSLYCKVRY